MAAPWPAFLVVPRWAGAPGAQLRAVGAAILMMASEPRPKTVAATQRLASPAGEPLYGVRLGRVARCRPAAMITPLTAAASAAERFGMEPSSAEPQKTAWSRYCTGT